MRTQTLTRLARFFNCDRNEAEQITHKLAELGLVEINGEEVKRIHKHTILPPIPGAFDLRRQILLKTLEFNVRPSSYVANFHTFITEDSFKKIMELIYFTRANIIRLENVEKPGPKKRYQIALIANTIDEG